MHLTLIRISLKRSFFFIQSLPEDWSRVLLQRSRALCGSPKINKGQSRYSAVSCNFYLSRVLKLQHTGVVVRFACGCLGGADEVAQSFGHVFHCVDQDHLQSTEPVQFNLMPSNRTWYFLDCGTWDTDMHVIWILCSWTICPGVSMYTQNNSGPWMEPWGTLQVRGATEEVGFHLFCL